MMTTIIKASFLFCGTILIASCLIPRDDMAPPVGWQQ